LLPMESLGKPGWFTAPRPGRDIENTLFQFLTGDLAQPPHVDATVALDPENPHSTTSQEKDSWKEDEHIQRIWAWDQAARSGTTGTSLAHVPEWIPALSAQLFEWAAGKPLVKKS
jgi:hypothetical protein